MHEITNIPDSGGRSLNLWSSAKASLMRSLTTARVTGCSPDGTDTVAELAPGVDEAGEVAMDYKG